MRGATMTSALLIIFSSIVILCAIGGYMSESGWDTSYRIEGIITGALVGFTVSVLAFIFVVLPASIIGQSEQTQEFTLVSAQDTTGVKGSFVWGTGSVSSGLTLNYYVQKDGYVSPRGTYGKPTRIFEVEQGPYRVVEHYTKCTWWICLDYTDNWTFDLYVPPGSVINDYNMDAK